MRVEKVLEGFNDLKTVSPDLLREWDYGKNDINGIFPNEVSTGSKKKVFWKCKNGHEWNAEIGHRSQGRGCPICARRRVGTKQQKRVINIETGQIFDSVNAAAQWVSISPSTLVTHLKGRQESAAGYHWKYFE